MADKIVIPTRDELVRQYERDYVIRKPGSLVGENTEPGVDARVLADQRLPIYAEASRAGGAADLDNLTATDLEDEAEDHGLARRLDPVGAAGAADAQTSAGGVTVFVGTIARHPVTKLRYGVAATRLYVTGDQIPLLAVDTGPSTNVVAGTLLEWDSPPLGLAPQCTVSTQNDGTGLTGGRLQETDEEIRERIREEKSNPAVAGNAADYIRAARETPGVAIQAAFAYPAVLGPGTMGLAFTLRPSAVGASRRPNAAQIAAVRAHVIGKMPEDDGLFVYALLSDDVTFDLKIRWKRTAAGWVDSVPWPAYHATQPVSVSTVVDSTHFTLTTAQSTPVQPVNGQSIAFYDNVNQVFRRKKILTFTGTNPWVITCDTSNSVSDITYTPTFSRQPGPWSDSLSLIAPPLLGEIDKTGPGDHSTFDTGGRRRRRVPSSAESYPYDITGRVLTPIYAVPALDDIQVAFPPLPRATALGTYGVTAFIPELIRLHVYPL